MTDHWLHGVHDVDGAGLMGSRPGWIVITEAIGCDPNDHSGRDYTGWTNKGFAVIVRLNNGYAPGGTIPEPARYEDFAKRCANYVYASPGCDIVVIGNEPNHKNEWPNGQKIMPADYADCFRKCRQAIDALGGDVQVLVAGPAPWDNTSGLDWLDYFRSVLTTCGPCDGVAIHAYTHGGSPALITSEEIVNGWHWQFRVYRDQCELLSDLHLQHLPVYITETDQYDPWLNENNGWVQAAYAEIDEWNVFDSPPLIRCLCLYRSNRDDEWSFAGKDGVKEDFQLAVMAGYRAADQPSFLPPDAPPGAPESIPDRVIDPALYLRGVQFTWAQVPAGTWYWKVVEAQWLDEKEADGVGPDHHILGEIIKGGVETAGVPLKVTWPSGFTTVISKADDLFSSYNYDYPMSSSLNEYSIWVDDGAASDKVAGIGMGKEGNPSIHTSTWVTWQWVQAAEAAPEPPSSEIKTGYVTATAGLNVRSGPGTSFATLGTLAYDSTVLYDDEHGGWLHVVDGWVSGEFVSPTPLLVPEPPGPLPPSYGSSDSRPDGGQSEGKTGGLVHPLGQSVITQHFYENKENYYEQWGLLGHDGTDLGGRPEGTLVRCMADGVVARADFDADYGNYLLIAHDQLACYTMYCHASDLLVEIGDEVKGGQTIMLLGSTGNSTGPHLHLEVRMMNADGSYKENTPMVRGRVDPQTWAYQYGLEL
jgi:murein DD-endopeptidase MepM/ murein hydrolase activator NlpD